MTVDSYLHRGQNRIRQLAKDPRTGKAGRIAAYAAAGFCLSAASLANSPQTFCLGLISAFTGWRSLVLALGSAVGYRVFWGTAGSPGLFWALGGGILALSLGKSKLRREVPLLFPALCALIPALTGLTFQLLGRDIPTLAYLLRWLWVPLRRDCSGHWCRSGKL